VRKTYRATAKEKDGNGEVLQITRSPDAILAAQVLQEDIGSAVGENQSALNKLGGWNPSLPSFSLTTQIPRPTRFVEASRPAAQGEKAHPKEDTSLDPVSKSTENRSALLKKKERKKKNQRNPCVIAIFK
jgi:hypothetical protein